jgi:hypothetical protein
LNRTLLCRVQLIKTYLLISAEGTVGRREWIDEWRHQGEARL